MIVLQQGCGPYEVLLDLVAPLNAEKCRAQGMEYRPIREQRLKGRYQPCEKYLWVEEALADDDALWIDGDAWICGDEPLNRLDGADLAGVRNSFGEINTGVVWFRRGEEVVEFIRKVVKAMHGQNPWSEQQRANQLLPYSGLKVNVIDSRWNSYRNVMHRPTTPIQIRTFHDLQAGPVQKAKRMQVAIQKGAA